MVPYSLFFKKIPEDQKRTRSSQRKPLSRAQICPSSLPSSLPGGIFANVSISQVTVEPLYVKYSYVSLTPFIPSFTHSSIHLPLLWLAISNITTTLPSYSSLLTYLPLQQTVPPPCTPTSRPLSCSIPHSRSHSRSYYLQKKK